MKKIKKRLKALEAFSHEPQDIAPRIHNEFERLAILGRLFEDVPTYQLVLAAEVGLLTYNYGDNAQ